MKKGAIIAIIIIAVLGVLAAMMGAIGYGIYYYYQGHVPGKTIIELDLRQGFSEKVSDDPLQQLMSPGAISFKAAIEGIYHAAEDERVAGLIARTDYVPMGLAQIQEIRDAIKTFKDNGKFTVAYAETFGEMSSGVGGYYLASIFDEVYIQPSGDVGLVGLMFESYFLKNAAEKLGVKIQMDNRENYKSAMYLYTEKEFNQYQEESMTKLMNSLFQQIVRGIAQGRNMDENHVRNLFDQGPFLGPDALEAKLVDGLEYRDEVYKKVKSRVGQPELLYLQEYYKRAEGIFNSGQTVALIYGIGMVARGQDGFNPLMGSRTMGSDTVTAAFRSALEDSEVEAILFRVDSPGGSYVASDSIWREVKRATDQGVPVVVSMGSVAASGGYFVAMPASKIVAQPSTITGSIGVVAGKMITNDVWNKLGITFDDVQSSNSSSFFSTSYEYTPEQYEKFQGWLDRVYADFTQKAAEGRNMDRNELLKYAQGKVWTGESALEIGLVDALGGYIKAVELCKDLAGIPQTESINLVTYPRKKWYEQFRQPVNSEQMILLQAFKDVFETVKPLFNIIGKTGILKPNHILESQLPEQVNLKN